MESQPISYNFGNETSPEMDLLAASSIGDLGLVHRLLQQGANVDLPNESGWTPLMYAAHYGHYNVVKMLIDYGANVNVTEKSQGRTPLMLAASCGHTRCLEVLITLGAADIEMTDSQGHNAAYYAIHSGHGRNKIIAKLLKIQGKSRSSSSSAAPSSSSAGSFAASSGGSRIRPLTKGRSEALSGSHTAGNNVRHNNRGHFNGTISSNKVTSTSTIKPDIIVSQDHVGSKLEDSSPFPGPSGSVKMNDDSGNCAYYSPYLPLSRDGSPIGGHFTSSLSQFISPSSSISSPFSVNNGLTPQLTFDKLIGKRRLPMGNQTDRYSGQAFKSLRRDQLTSITTSAPSAPTSAAAAYNLLTAAGCSSQQYQPATTNSSSSKSLGSSLTTITEPPVQSAASISNSEELTPKEMNNLIDEACRLNSAYSLNDFTLNKRSSPGVIGSQLRNKSPANKQSNLTSSPNCSVEANTSDTRVEAGVNCPVEVSLSATCASSSPSVGTNSGDESSLPPVLGDASSSSVFSNTSSSVLDRSRSPLPENLDSLLERVGLSQYIPLFASHGIDLYCFLTLNEADFEEIGITLLGHKRKLYMAQLRFRESVEIVSTQERFFADWLLSERENLKKENHELKMKLKGIDVLSNPMSIYNQLLTS